MVSPHSKRNQQQLRTIVLQPNFLSSLLLFVRGVVLSVLGSPTDKTLLLLFEQTMATAEQEKG